MNESKNKSKGPPKKPYAAPRLRSYGDLRKLTGGGTRAGAERGGAKTKGGAG